jgi:general stress protein 26
MDSNIREQDVIDSFKHSKIVYLVTLNNEGVKHSRPMTNFNDNPYDTLWFPSYNNTTKVEDIKDNPHVSVLFPSVEKDQFYEIKGKAQLAERHEVEEKWVWWYLYWHPEMNDYFWFDQTGKHPERVILNVTPESILKLDKDDVKFVKDTYSTLMPRD